LRAKALGRSLGALQNTGAALQLLVGDVGCRELISLQRILLLMDNECKIVVLAVCDACIFELQPVPSAHQLVAPRGVSFQVRSTATPSSYHKQPPAASQAISGGQQKPATAAASNRSSQLATQPPAGLCRSRQTLQRGMCNFRGCGLRSWAAEPRLVSAPHHPMFASPGRVCKGGYHTWCC